MEWEIDRRAGGDGEGNELANIQISLPPSLSPHSLSKICVTKWTYNWKSGGPEIPCTFPPTRLDISSAELRGRYEHMGGKR